MSMTPEQLAIVKGIRDSARGGMDRAIKSTMSSLQFAAPEIWEIHLDRLSKRSVEIGVDMALALLQAGIKPEDTR